MNALVLYPKRKPLPSVLLTLKCLLRLAMTIKKLGHPRIPSVAIDRRRSVMLFSFEFGPERFCLRGVVGIVGAEASRAMTFYVVSIKEDHIPIWRAYLAIKIGHSQCK